MDKNSDDDGWQRNTIDFAFYHSLIDEDPKITAPALKALGRIAAGWSRLEHHIDALIIQINKPEHSEKIFQPHPVSFSKKIELLKRWFNQYPPLAEYTEDMRWFTSKMKEISSNKDAKFLSRNLVLHAIPASYDPATEIVVLHHMRFVGENIHSMHVDVSISQMNNFADATVIANDFLSSITKELFTATGYKKLEKRE